jgi:hypothetical protein
MQRAARQCKSFMLDLGLGGRVHPAPRTNSECSVRLLEVLLNLHLHSEFHNAIGGQAEKRGGALGVA